MAPFKMRLSFSLFDCLILKMSLLPLLVRINPLVKVRPALESWFSVVHPPSSTHAPPAGAGVAASGKVGQGPDLSTRGSRDLAFPSCPKASERTSTPPACQPQPQVGGEVASRKTCTFLRTNAMQLDKGVAAAASQKPQPRPLSRRALPDLFGADLPKAMPYWFCTNRVH